MNDQPKNWWEDMVAAPHRFFLLLAAVSIVLFFALFLLMAALAIQPAWLRQVIAFTVAATILGFLAGIFGFVFALIPPFQPCCRWVVRRSVFIAACLITLVALFYAEENWRGRRAWTEFKRAAAVKGEPVEIQQIIPPPVADEQNFAAAPLIQELCREFDPEWRRLHTGPAGLTNAADRLKFRHTRAREDGPDKATALWQIGRRADLKAWQDYYRTPPSVQTDPGVGMAPEAAAAFQARYGITPASAAPASTAAPTNEFPTTPSPQSPAADVLLALSPQAALVEELRAAAERPHARFPIRYEDGFSAVLPHLARLKGINHFLALRAAAELEAGQPEQAAADARLGLRLAGVVRGEPFLISQLVRIAQMQIALNPIWEGLVEHRWTDPQLAAFEEQLRGEDLLADYQRGMRGERTCCNWTIDLVARERRAEFLEIGGSSTDPMERLLGTAVLHLIPGGWFDQNKATVGRLHLETTLPSVDIAGHRVSPGTVKQLADSLDRQLKRRTPYNFFGRLLLPALATASMRSAQAQVSVDLARVAIALERHRLALGGYPEKLDALAPRFLPQVPHDLINGEPLRYRRTADGTFLLYSVGWNETDDGGTVALLKNQRNLDWKEGDWVWPATAKPGGS